MNAPRLVDCPTCKVPAGVDCHRFDVNGSLVPDRERVHPARFIVYRAAMSCLRERDARERHEYAKVRASVERAELRKRIKKELNYA